MAGLDMILPYHLVKLGLDTELGVYNNFTTEDKPLSGLLRPVSLSARFGSEITK